MTSLRDLVPWGALDGMEPLDRARAAAALLEEIPEIQRRLGQVRGMAVAQLREQHNSSAVVAELLGVSAARVGQIIDGGVRGDGIRLGLLKDGLLLALEFGRLQPGDDRKVQQALEALSRPGRKSPTVARGVAIRLATIRTSAVDTAAMTDTQRALWQRAMAHAYDVMRGEQHHIGEVNEDWPNPIGKRGARR
jgi:hypothetical protein